MSNNLEIETVQMTGLSCGSRDGVFDFMDSGVLNRIDRHVLCCVSKIVAFDVSLISFETLL